jgi:hypothetical protein
MPTDPGVGAVASLGMRGIIYRCRPAPM